MGEGCFDFNMERKANYLYHYTALEALFGIVDLEQGKLHLRLSNPLECNDKKEIHFFEKYVFKHQSGMELQNKVEEMKTSFGEPYSFSLIQHLAYTNFGAKGYPHCEIPMWSMYGDNFKGVRLQFRFKKLSEYINPQSKDVELSKCQYLKANEMEEKGRIYRRQKENMDVLYRSIPFFKSFHWVYENEWRIVSWIKKENEVRHDGKDPFMIDFPLQCLTKICVGSKVSDVDYKNVINVMKDKLQTLKIAIERSSLKIN